MRAGNSMAHLHLEIAAAEERCGYLPGRESAVHYRILTDVTPEEMEALLERGWRRFGLAYFRPVCADCAECVSLRVPVAGFHPSKSQRRAWKRCAGLRVEIRRPVADEERLQLYLAWHQMREETRGWEPVCDSMESYAQTFCMPHPCARELDYYAGDRLVGVGLVDETPNALSSVYFYYHPEWRDRSLGTASVLFELAHAAERGRSHLYLGFRVQACLSTAYKSAFRPHELLEGRPDADTEPLWIPPLPEVRT